MATQYELKRRSLGRPYLVPRSPATTTFHLLFDRSKSDGTRRLSCTRQCGFPFFFLRYGHRKNYGTEKQTLLIFHYYYSERRLSISSRLLPTKIQYKRTIYRTSDNFENTVFRKRYTSTRNSWVSSEKRINVVYTSGRQRGCFY